MKIKNMCKSKFTKILIICIALIAVMFIRNTSYASVLGMASITGIELILVVAIQWLVLVVGITAGEILDAITGLGEGKQDAFLLQVLFNKVPSVRANFFPAIQGPIDSQSAMATIIAKVGQTYSIIRNLSIALLLGILIYVGIRMAISTVASEEAKYKRMFKDWALGFGLLFVLHFIIIATFYFNDVIVEALYKTIGSPADINMAKLAAHAAVPFYGWPETIIYVSLVTSSLVFVLMYIKRIITLGFLIVIAPLITVTYSIDKMGDGKSQALNTWLKEFMYTVLIQPFHCVIYIIFVNTAFSLMAQNYAEGVLGQQLDRDVLAIMSILFLLKAESIVKKIFGIKADSMADALKTGGEALAVMTALKSSKKPVSKGKGKMPGMKDNVKPTGEPGGIPSSGPSIGGGSSSGPTTGGGSGGSGSTSSSSGGSSSTSSSSTGTGSSGTGSAGTAPKSPDSNNVQYEADKARAKREAAARKAAAKPANKLADEIRNHYQRKAAAAGFNGKDAIKNHLIGETASKAAAVIGATMGATVGDASTAVNTGYAMHNMASGIEGSLNDYSNQKQLDHNQQVFAGAYEEFAAEYRKEFGDDVTDEQIMAAAENIYEGGGANLEEGYQLDFYNQMDDLASSAEIMGYSDGMDFVKDSMRLTNEGKITPPDDYRRKGYNYTEDELYKRDLKKIVKAEGGKDGPMYTELKELDNLIAANRNDPDKVKMYKEMRKQKMEKFKGSL